MYFLWKGLSSGEHSFRKINNEQRITGIFKLNRTLLLLQFSDFKSRSNLKSHWAKINPNRLFREPSKLKSKIIPLLLVDSPFGAVYLCALRGYWLRDLQGSGDKLPKRKKNVSLVFIKRQGEQMLSCNHRDHHSAELRAAVRNKVPVAKRGPGALRPLLHKLGLSWLWGGRALAGGCRGLFALNTPTGRAATSRAAHQPAGGRHDLLPWSGVCGQRSVLGEEWTLLSQTQHRTFIILICLSNDSYMRSARTILVIQ